MSMKRLLTTVLVTSGMAMAAPAQELPRPSPKAQTMQVVGLTEIEVSYGRPAVRGREIFGGLVPFDRVWRTGANEATTIRFSSDVTVEGKPLAAGLYSVHTIPGEDEWTIIFNSQAEQWGSYQYDQEKDSLRVQVQPKASAHPHERLTFSFAGVDDDSTTLMLEWDELSVPIRIQVPTRELVLAGLRHTMAEGPEDWRVGHRAASWAFDSGVALDEALVWIDHSIGRSATWANQALKARMLASTGKFREAIETAERAIEAGRSATPAADVTPLESEVREWRGRL